MNNVYLIYGSLYGLIKREVEKIVGNHSDVVSYDLSLSNVSELLDDASCMSLFGEEKVLIGENADFLTSSGSANEHNIEYLTKYLEDDNHNNIVIFTATSDTLDGKKKIVKLFKEKATVIKKELIDEKKLYSFVTNEFKNNGFSIDYKTSNYFVNYVGKNVDIILKEIDKMVLYKEDDKVVTIKDIDDIASKAFKDNIFDFTDGIMKKDFKKIFECYNDLKLLKMDESKIIALLAKQFDLYYDAKLLQKEGSSQSVIADLLEVHPYRVKLALETDYMLYEVKDILKKLHNLDYGIKSGTLSKETALENFLLQL